LPSAHMLTHLLSLYRTFDSSLMVTFEEKGDKF